MSSQGRGSLLCHLPHSFSLPLLSLSICNPEASCSPFCTPSSAYCVLITLASNYEPMPLSLDAISSWEFIQRHFTPKAVLGPKYTPTYKVSPCANSSSKHRLGSILFPLLTIKHNSLVILNSANGTKKTIPEILLPFSSPHTMIKSSQSYLLQVSLYLSCGHLLSQACTQPVSWEANVFSYVFPAPILHGAATLFLLPKKVDLVVSFLFFSITENLYIFFKLKFKCPESYTESPS